MPEVERGTHHGGDGTISMQTENAVRNSMDDYIEVETSRFGQLRVERDKIITMLSPFLGFPASKQFFLKPHGEDSPFMWLQSLDDPQLAFVVVQPELFLSEYSPVLQPFVLDELQVAKENDPEILVILTIPAGKPREMTANLLGPVVFNVDKRLAKQVLLDPNRYDPCWKVIRE